MSSSGERARNSSEEEILLAEHAILSAEDSSPGLAGILQDIQKSLVNLAQASKDLSTAFQNLHEDLLLRQDSDLTIEQGDETGTDTVKPTNVKALLGSDRIDLTSCTLQTDQSSDPEPKSDLLESLTQAHTGLTQAHTGLTPAPHRRSTCSCRDDC